MNKCILKLALIFVITITNFVFAEKSTARFEAPGLGTAEPISVRDPNPRLDATAFGLGTGIYGNLGILGGHLQIVAADWLRLSGSITGALPGDQPAGNFALANYRFLWQFSGGLVFTSTTIYKNLARPYTALELTYYYDAGLKAGGLNGSFRVGLDLYMTEDYSIYIESGVIAAFMRDAQAPQLGSAVMGIGARAYF